MLEKIVLPAAKHCEISNRKNEILVNRPQSVMLCFNVLFGRLIENFVDKKLIFVLKMETDWKHNAVKYNKSNF